MMKYVSPSSTDHGGGKPGHRAVSGLTRERIEAGRYHDRPGAALSLLKMLRVLIHHAMSLDDSNPLKLRYDPSAGIKRPKAGEIRAWTDTETAAFERRWPLGSKERTAYALMLYVGTARADIHRMTWRQIDEVTSGITYTRSKTGVRIDIDLHDELRRALEHAARDHVTIVNTAFGRPFTAAGFSQFMRKAIKAAGLPIDCKPHGLRKTLGRRLPMTAPPRTRSWRCSATQRLQKQKDIRARPIDDAEAVKVSRN
jgi:enterobacteria phage integrase